MGTCESCGAHFAVGNDIVQGSCPECGSQFYRRDPVPTHSDMEMRNMPAPGEKDMGGNPLQEGILADGGWQNRKVRDESFASVNASMAKAAGYDDWLEQPYQDREDLESLDPQDIDCPECGTKMNQHPTNDRIAVCPNPKCRDEIDIADYAQDLADDAALQGHHYADVDKFKIYNTLVDEARRIQNTEGPEAAEAWLQGQDQNVEGAYPEIINAVRQTLGDEPMPNLNKLLPDQFNQDDFSIADMEQQEVRNKRGEPSVLEESPVKVDHDDLARQKDFQEFMKSVPNRDGETLPEGIQRLQQEDDARTEKYGPLDQTAPENPVDIDESVQNARKFNEGVYTPNLGWEPGQHGRGVLLYGGNTRGEQLPGHVNYGDEADPSRAALHTWPYDPEDPMGSDMHGQYLEKLGINPSSPDAMKNTGMFTILPDGTVKSANPGTTPERVQHAVQADPRLTPEGQSDFGGGGGFSFSNVSHSQIVSSEPHGSWLVESDADFDIDNADVIPPGGNTIEVTSPVLHNGNLGPMAQLGVQIDGKDLRDPAVMREYFERSGTPQKGPITVALSHDDPERLQMAKEMAELGGATPAHQKYLDTQHKATINPAEGIHDRLHNALGAFGAYVSDPNSGELLPYQQHHETIRPAYTGGPLNIAHKNPEVVDGIKTFADTGDAQKLLELQQRGAKVAFGLGDIGDALEGAPVIGPAMKELNPDTEGIVGDIGDFGRGIGLLPENLSVGELAGTAAWLIPGGLAAKGGLAALKGANALRGAGAASSLATGAASRGAGVAGTLASKAKSIAPTVRNSLAVHGGLNMAQNSMNGVTQMAQPTPYTPPPPPRTIQQLTHVAADHPSSDPLFHPDAHEVKDGDNSAAYDVGVNDIGGTDATGKEGPTDDPQLNEEFDHWLPVLITYYLSESGARENPDPDFQQFLDRLEEHGLLNSELANDDDLEPIWDELAVHFGGHDPDAPKNELSAVGLGSQANAPNLPATGVNPGHVPRPPQAPAAPQAPNALPGTANCPRCGAPVSPGATTCPNCQSGMGVDQQAPQPGAQPGVQQIARTAYSPQEMQMLQTPQTTAPVGQGQPVETPAQPIPQADYSASSCPHCGYNMPAGSAICPHCNQSAIRMPQAQPQQQVAAKTGADHQGPHNNEQFAAVAELLTSEGRQDEIPAMLAEPWNYAEEMARAMNRTTKPPIDDTLTDAPPAPAVEEAPPGATMPVPGMDAPQMTAAIQPPSDRDLLATIAEGDLGSGPYGGPIESLIKQGLAEYTDHGDVVITDAGRNRLQHEATQKTAEPIDHHEAENPINAPAADRISPEDHREEQDTSLQWVDSNGEPLKVGQEYEMDSPGWTIPDIIKVRQVKPDGISVIIQSEQGLDASTEIDKHEMELERYTFTPSDATSVDEPIEDNIGNPDDPRQLPAAGSEQSDLSQPHFMMTHKQATPDSLSPRCPKCNSGTTGIASEDGAIQCHACGNVFDAPILKDPKISKMFLHQCPAGHPFGSRHRTASNLQCPECGSALDPTTGLGEGVEERAFPQQDHPNPGAFTSEDPAISPQQQTTPIQPQAGFVNGPSEKELGIWLGEDPAAKHLPGGQADQDNAFPNVSEGEANQTAFQQSWDQTFEKVKAGVYGDWQDLRRQAVQYIQEERGPDSEDGISSSDINHTLFGLIRSGEIQPLQTGPEQIEEPGFLQHGISPEMDPEVEAEMRERDSNRTAGKKYTPMEQREFINESGTARNRDKLQLDGTHYAEVEDDDNFLFGW